MKIVDIDTEKLSEDLGRCPKNLQGTRPLTHFAGAARTVLTGSRPASTLADLMYRIIREPYVKGLSRHILTGFAGSVFHGSLDNGSAPAYEAVSFLHFKYSLLAEEDYELPFSWHISAVGYHFILNERTLVIMYLMRTKKVVISNPKCEIIVGTIVVIKSVCGSVRGLYKYDSDVQSFACMDETLLKLHHHL